MQEYSTLVQYGGIGVALAALWIIYKMQNGQRTEFMQELKANRESHEREGELNRQAMEKMANGAQAQALALGELTTRIKTLPADRRLSSRHKPSK